MRKAGLGCRNVALMNAPLDVPLHSPGLVRGLVHARFVINKLAPPATPTLTFHLLSLTRPSADPSLNKHPEAHASMR